MSIKLGLFLQVIFALNFSSKLFAQETSPDYQRTGLPVCYVDYDPSTTITKEEKTKAVIMICTEEDTLKSEVQIAGRGNYTWTAPKKPYNLKFEKTISILGMREGKKYALMANVCDPSMMRIALGFEAGRWVGFDWTLEGRYVELVINGKHQGCYFLAERVSKTTVDIDDNHGYVLEYKYENQVTDESINFLTAYNEYIMEFKIPDNPVVGGDMYENAVSSMNHFEEELCNAGTGNDNWKQLIDMDNFARWYYWVNLLQMEECNMYYVFQNYQEQIPLKMGPVWDFDWSVGTMPVGASVVHRESPFMRNMLYFDWISKDNDFLKKVAKLHFELREEIARKADELYDSLSVLLRPSKALDEKIWGAGPFWDSTPNWDEELTRDRSYFMSTLTFLDKALAPYMDKERINGINSPLNHTNVSHPFKLLHNGRVYILHDNKIFDCEGRRVRE